jgi:hypothetical protein
LRDRSVGAPYPIAVLADDAVDALRAIHPPRPARTYWSYLRDRCAADKAMRLDHIFLAMALAGNLSDAETGRWVCGEPEAGNTRPGRACSGGARKPSRWLTRRA